MDNKTEYFFVLKPDGKIGWIEKMPEIPEGNIYRDTQWYAETGGYKHPDEWYKDRLQSAISNAIEVENEREVKDAIGNKYALFQSVRNGWSIEKGKVYALQCHVEKKQFCASDICDTDGQCEHCREPKTLALVTFSEPSAGVEETQEELWKQMFQQIDSRMDFMKFLLEHYTITRKNK